MTKAMKLWRQNNKGRWSSICKRSRQRHAATERARLKRWRQQNKSRINAYHKNWRQVPANKIAQNLRIRINGALRGKSKSSATLVLLGCGVDELIKHLEAQFKPGMSWDNYGQWHVDHKRPCASFDLSQESQQRECFHYTNLQPLWAEDNIAKGAK